MNFHNSPFNHIMDMFKSSDAILEFSRYVYRPQSLLDERTIIELPASELSMDWFDEILLKLDCDEELAFHSRVKFDRKTLHIPMIDFCCDKSNIEYAKSCIEKSIGIRLSSGLNYYDSGRSMHAYGSHLLAPVEWRRLMGKLLLANFPNAISVVDSRWIGHRVIGGFSSLRLSNNTDQYLKYPSKI